MALPENVQDIPTGRLMDEYRALVMQVARTEGAERKAASRKADGHEEEILRRMAW